MNARIPLAPSPATWLQRPGLAGGIDQDGGRAAELLGHGFGSVEFGSVTAQPLPGHNVGVAALVQALKNALAAAPQSAPQGRAPCAVGIGLGVPAAVALEHVAAQWLAGFAAAAEVAHYVSLNLSARAHQRLLEPAGLAVLGAAFVAVATLRDQTHQLGREGQHGAVRLAIKLPGTHPGASTAAALALAAGIDQLTVVLPDTGERWACLSALRQQVGAGPDLVAVGGIRCRADVDRARACGASGVQVHRLFTAQGAQCLQELIQPTCSDGDADS